MAQYSEYGGVVRVNSAWIGATTPLSAAVVQLDVNNANHLVDEAGQHLVNVTSLSNVVGESGRYAMWTRCATAFDHLGSFVFPVHLVPQTALPYGIVVRAKGKVESGSATFLTCLNTIDREPSIVSAIEADLALKTWEATISGTNTIADGVAATYPAGLAINMLQSHFGMTVLEYDDSRRRIEIPALRLSFYCQSLSGDYAYITNVHAREYRV